MILTVATAHAAPAVGGARPIAIVINGNALSLDPPSRFVANTLFVPVRRTIEALGLGFERSGNRITTQIGSKTVTLTIGNRTAEVDGSPFALEAPPIEIRDVIYAPLRFFTDVLGAQAHFDRRTNSVIIVAQIVGRSSNGFVTTGNGYERFGSVAAVDVLSDPPTMTLRWNGGVKTIPVAPNATIDVEDVDVNVSSPGELGDVRPGDFARVEMRKDGRVSGSWTNTVRATGTSSRSPEASSCSNDGHVIAPDGRHGDIAQRHERLRSAILRPGDQVTVRYNVETNEVREILSSRSTPSVVPSAGGAAIPSLDSDASRPLRAGETVHVTMHGTAGGSATFDIGSDVVNQAMGQRSPGVYDGAYTIPRGANFDDVALHRAICRRRSNRSSCGSANGLRLERSAGHLGFCAGCGRRRSTRTGRPSTQASFPMRSASIHRAPSCGSTTAT